MSIKSISRFLAVQLLLAGVTLAAGYITNFDSISGNATLSDADGWVTNDPYDVIGDFGQADFVGVIPGYSTTVDDHWAALGGITGFAPGQPTIILSRPVDLTGASRATFTVAMAVSSSAIPRANKDTFGWTFRNSSDITLFSLLLDPNTADNNGLNIRMYNSSNVELTAYGSGDYDIYYNSIYSLEVFVNELGFTTVNFTDGNLITTQVITNAVTGINPADIAGVAATWILKVPATAGTEQTAYGSNALIFDNYSLIPEPSSTLLVSVATLALLARRKRI